MRDFTFSMPTRIVFGRGAEDRVGEEVLAAGGRRALVVLGGGHAERSGLLARIEASLARAGVESVCMGGVRPNPGSGLVYRAIARARAEGADLVLAVGGGSVIDTAKAVAAGVPYEGDFWDFFSGSEPVRALPVGVVLTIAASGSEVSRDAVITRDETMLKREMNSDLVLPRFAILDPVLTESLPPFQTACGLVDMFTHLLERYLTRTVDTGVSDGMAEGLMRAIVEESPRVMRDPRDYGARANVMWAASLAHCDITGADRSQDWASHDIEYALSSRYGCAHGAGLAVIVPSVLSYGLEAGAVDEEGRPCAARRLARLAERVWGCSGEGEAELAPRAVDRFRSWCAGLGMPSTISALAEEAGMAGEDPAEAISAMARETCWEGGRGGTVGGYIELDEAAVAEILTRAW